MLNYCAIPSFGLLDTETFSPRQVSLFSSALIVHVKQCFDIFLSGPLFQPAWWFSLLISLHTPAKWSGEPPFHPLVLHLTPFSLSVSWQLQSPLIAGTWEQEIFFIFRGWNEQGMLRGEKENTQQPEVHGYNKINILKKERKRKNREKERIDFLYIRGENKDNARSLELSTKVALKEAR